MNCELCGTTIEDYEEGKYEPELCSACEQRADEPLIDFERRDVEVTFNRVVQRRLKNLNKDI